MKHPEIKKLKIPILSWIYKVLKRLFGRVFFITLSVIVQILWFSLFIYILGARYPFFVVLIRFLSLAAVLWIVNKRINPSYKLAWTLLILLLPIIGISFYLMFGRSRVASQFERNYTRMVGRSRHLMKEDSSVRRMLELEDPRVHKQSVYLRDYASAPVYAHTVTEYFPEGEDLYHAMVRELEAARHFIFMEYFIIDNGEMWGSILDILERKVREGLDVRLIYDDVGCVNTLPAKFYREIRARGIQCEVFNPFRPVVSIFFNNRDHRKIMVIDGWIGFTGGINLADEYINRKMRFGHWKDTGILLKGEAVWNFTAMFLQMWGVLTGDTQALSVPERYEVYYSHRQKCENDGFVQPYSDIPLDYETVGENVYLNIIAQAEKYVYIFTPYLIIDNEIMTVLCLAAKSGVDVRIVTPGVPDKRVVFWLTRSYYEQLIDAGVRIYEYQPGFLHAKSFVCDDEIATVGTINLDYRSLYLHFECGVWMYRSKAVMQVKEDVLRTLKVSREITKEECMERSLPMRLTQSLLRLLAPTL